MRLYYLDRVILKTVDANLNFVAQSINGSKTYTDCEFMSTNARQHAAPSLGRHALLANIGGKNIILGYYNEDYERDYHVYLEGEQLIMAGKGRAICLGNNGDIGIYAVEREDDGSVSLTPKLVFNRNNELKASVEALIVSLIGCSAGGTISITKDEITGYYRYAFNGRGNHDDKHIRFKDTIEGTIGGMTREMIFDVTPSPLSPAVVPALPEAMAVNPLIVNQMQYRMSPTLPLQLLFTIASIPNVSIEISPIGELTIKTGPGGLASITMTPLGTINIDAALGVEITGKTVGLVQTLIEFVQEYQTHIHPTPTGPSGMPLPPAGVQTALKLNLIKAP